VSGGKKKLAGMFYTYVDTFYVPTYSSREMQYLFSTPSISSQPSTSWLKHKQHGSFPEKEKVLAHQERTIV
jgi:hypothetical protein